MIDVNSHDVNISLYIHTMVLVFETSFNFTGRGAGESLYRGSLWWVETGQALQGLVVMLCSSYSVFGDHVMQ